MGLYIKGMEMPKACLACDFCNPFTEEPYCRRLMKVTSKTTTLPDCPLIEVPEPHGRLIDADAFTKSECNNCDGSCESIPCNCLNCTADCRCDFIKDIADAPIIIPAEEAEK